VANTAATVANTAAQVANNAARAGGVVAAAGPLASALSTISGRLAGLLPLVGRLATMVKGLSLAAVIMNLQDIGQWIAKTAYGLTDVAKREKAIEIETRANEMATKAAAAAEAERTQQMRLAEEASLGLSGRSIQLVADFEKLRQNGEKAGDAVKKLGKELDVSSVQGIAEAGAALDALARKGQISASQVRDAWMQALSGQDLRIFEVQAIAAFDGTAQGAARLAAALDAVLDEAVKRTGKDLGELAGGIGAGAQKAIGDFDTLLTRMDEVQAKGLDVGEVLASSLDQASKAAGTEAAMRAIVERWEDLGRQGLVAGDRLRQGLDGAKAKLDELAPGITSVTEAWKTLGLRSQDELRRTAEVATQAYQTILNSGDRGERRGGERCAEDPGGHARPVDRCGSGGQGHREVDERRRRRDRAVCRGDRARARQGGRAEGCRRAGSRRRADGQCPWHRQSRRRDRCGDTAAAAR